MYSPKPFDKGVLVADAVSLSVRMRDSSAAASSELACIDTCA